MDNNKKAARRKKKKIEELEFFSAIPLVGHHCLAPYHDDTEIGLNLVSVELFAPLLKSYFCFCAYKLKSLIC